MSEELLYNPHAGDILKAEFLDPLEMSQAELARAISVPAGRISEIIHGKRAVTADTDLRLTTYFSLSEGFFMRLQTEYELMQAKRLKQHEFDQIMPLNLPDVA